MFLGSSCSCLCPIHWSQVSSREWRCRAAPVQLHLNVQQFHCVFRCTLYYRFDGKHNICSHNVYEAGNVFATYPRVTLAAISRTPMTARTIQPVHVWPCMHQVPLSHWEPFITITVKQNKPMVTWFFVTYTFCLISMIYMTQILNICLKSILTIELRTEYRMRFIRHADMRTSELGKGNSIICYEASNCTNPYGRFAMEVKGTWFKCTQKQTLTGHFLCRWVGYMYSSDSFHNRHKLCISLCIMFSAFILCNSEI